MGVPFWRQVRAVLWKNWLLKRKASVSTFFEVCACAWPGAWACACGEMGTGSYHNTIGA